MTGFEFTIGCPICAGELRHVNGRACSTEATAVVACDPCRREWTVSVFLRPLDSPERRRDRERSRRARARAMA